MPASGPQSSKRVVALGGYARWAGLCLLLLGSPAWGLSMVFINPGQSDEPFWRDASTAMRGAAQSLGVELEILYAERDYLAQISLTREVSMRPEEERPDYLIVAADKGTLGEQLALAEAAGIRSFSAYNAVQSEERERLGTPRQHYHHWLGSLIPRAEDAGYLTARALIERALAEGGEGEEGGLAMLAISGDRSTDSSYRRNQGMLAAVREYPQVSLKQVVHADWRQDKAAEQSEHLFRRYPEARLVWAGSDLMAFGAMHALRATGGTPGQDMYFSAVNTSVQAMQAVIDGQLAALAGGHYLNGAWSVVMLHDYHHGIDFAEDEGLELEHPMFTLFDADLARAFLARQSADAPAVDYCGFSKVCNPQRQRYDFSIQAWLEAPQ